MSESKPTYLELKERIRVLEDIEKKMQRAEAQLQKLNKRLADSMEARDRLARKLSALRSMANMPELYLDAEWNIVGYSPDFQLLTDRVEEFVRNKNNVREFLSEGAFGKISRYLEQVEKLRTLPFDQQDEWRLRYRGPNASERIGEDWVVHSSCTGKRWEIVEKRKKLRIVHRPHIRDEQDCYLISAGEFGGAGEDIKIIYTVKTSRNEEYIRDLSLIITEASGWEEVYPDSLGYTAAVAANGNSEGRLQRRGANLVSIPEMLEPNSEYRITVERTGGRLRRQICNLHTSEEAPVLEIIDADAIYERQNHFGFTTYSAEMQLYDIEVYTRKSRFPIDQFRLPFDFEAGIREPKLEGRWFRLRLGTAVPAGKPLYTLMFEDITRRKRVEEELRESKKRLEELYQEAPVGYHEIDQEGRIIRVNKTETALLGYAPEEMVGRFVWEFMLEEEQEVSRKAFRKKITWQMAVGEFERKYVCKDGRLIFALITDRLNQDKNGRVIGIRSTLQDITRRKKAEVGIIQLNRIYSILSEVNQAIVRIHDHSRLFQEICRIMVEVGRLKMAWAGLVDFKSRQVKPVACFGIGMEYLEKLNISLDDDPKSGGATGRAIRQGNYAICADIENDPEMTNWREQAKEIGCRFAAAFPLLKGSRVVGNLSVYDSEPLIFDALEITLLEELALDISYALEVMDNDRKRREAENELRKLLQAVEQSPVTVIITDRSGRIEYVNPKFTELTGYAFEEIKNKNPRFLKSGETPPEEYIRLWETILSGKVWKGEFRNRKKNGALYWESSSISPLFDKEGAITHFMALKEDITHKKHLEEAMVQSEKMASIGLLAAGVAHEINNPLGFIDSNLNTLSGYLKQFSKYIQETGKLINTDLTQKLPAAGPFIERFNQLGVDYELDFLVKDFKEAMEESLDGARRIKKIISTMKDFARAEKPVFQPADINDILEKSLDLVWNELKYKAEVVKEYDEVPLIECESDRLCQVFINLLINAAQAIEDKGVIRIKIFKNENSVVVKISDNGKGIPSVDLGKIFEVFYSTKEKDKGTGLGLSVSRKIIQDHNGTIEVDSCLGKGTTFTIMLPFKAGEKVAKYRVLIFDDDEGVRDILKVAVSEIRPLSAIRTAKDGFEVGNLLSAFKPDLVLLDIFMPGLNGFDVCQKIKSDPRYGAIKIIMISGVDERELAEKAAAAGADTFLAKPISMNALQQAISSFTDPAASRPQKGSGNNVRHS